MKFIIHEISYCPNNSNENLFLITWIISQILVIVSSSEYSREILCREEFSDRFADGWFLERQFGKPLGKNNIGVHHALQININARCTYNMYYLELHFVSLLQQMLE
jgi:hypothetical protein